MLSNIVFRLLLLTGLMVLSYNNAIKLDTAVIAYLLFLIYAAIYNLNNK